MTVRRSAVLVWMAAALAALVVVAPATADEAMAVAREVLAATPLVDGHNDLPWQLRERFGNRLEGLDLADTSRLDRPLQTDLARLRAGGVGGQFWSVYVPVDLHGGEAVAAVLEQIDVVHRMVARYPDALELAWSADDVRRAHAAGRVASLLGAEGGHSIDDSLAVLRQLRRLGVRYMTLTHWHGTAWADAATAPATVNGLSPFGVEVVREMNRLGMLVDLSHVSSATMHDALDASRAPVIFSHSGARAIDPHPRNVPDDVLARLPANGGVVMVNFGSIFVSPAYTSWWAEVKAERARLETLHPGDPTLVSATMDEWQKLHPAPPVTLDDLVRHIEHIRSVAGVDAVGLGSDYDGLASLPEGLEDVSGYPLLLAQLYRRGWSREDLAQLAGGNILRVMDAADAVARDLAAEPPSEARLESKGE